MQLLGPPLPAARSSPLLFTVLQLVNPFTAHESFQVVSGIYPFADAGTGAVLVVVVVCQNVPWLVTSSKSVPPTATLNGVDAVPLTEIPSVAAVSVPESPSHSAEPLSPDDTVTLIPCAAACSQSAFWN